MKEQSSSTGGKENWVLSYLGLGGNVGSREEVLRRFSAAMDLIGMDSGCRVTRVSSPYRTGAWGVTDQPDFYNAVAEVETLLEPADLLRKVKDIEQRLGRQPRERWGPREIDVDILLYGSLVVEQQGLQVPHPGMLQRAFVWMPLLELAPEVTLPNGEPVAEHVHRESFEAGTAERLELSFWCPANSRMITR